MAELDLWIISNDLGVDSAILAGFAQAVRYDYVRANDLEHVVHHILERLGPDGRVGKLHFPGHAYFASSPEDEARGTGGHGAQHVGRSEMSSLEGTGWLSRVFAPLRPRFAPGAQVILEGCQTGKAHRLLAALSAALGGVPVSGGTSNQRIFPGLEGAVRTCVQLPGGAPACGVTREATEFGAAAGWIDDNMVVPFIQDVRSAWSKHVAPLMIHLR